MNEKHITIDDKTFSLVEEGLYKAETPYTVNEKSWPLSAKHFNLNILCAVRDGKYSVLFLSNTNKGADALYEKYDKLLVDGSDYAVLSGLSQPKNLITTGELY